MKKQFKLLSLGFQHLAAMFGSTILVPLLTGLSPAIALLGAGVGTLIFHLITGGSIPVFLGSSFAFIAAIQYIGAEYGLAYATGGIMFAGVMYLFFSFLVRVLGKERIGKLFPPVITGSMIIVIGLTLAPSVIQGNIVDSAVGSLGIRWLVAVVVVGVVIVVSKFTKGFIQLLPILLGIVVGYLVAVLLNLVDFNLVTQAKWFSLPPFMAPKFNLPAISMMIPISIVTAIEHIGDMATISNVVGIDFIEKVGLDQTLIGDGIATIYGGLIGAPANTTYSENTGVLAITGNYDPNTLKVAAMLAILFSFSGKLEAILQSIPGPVMGGVSILLFGMIASVGIRTLVDGRVDFSDSKNSIIVAVMLVLGLSGVVVSIGKVTLSGMSLSAIVGILLNQITPEGSGSSE